MTPFDRKKIKAPARTAKMISLRVTGEEYAILKEIAEADGLTLSDLLRIALDEWTRRRKRTGKRSATNP